MSRIINLRKQIINALLSNDEVCGTLIAKQIGCDPNSANRVMRDLSKYLASRPAPNEPGKNRLYYSVADRQALINLRDKKRVGTNQYTSGTNSPAGINFDALLNVWGIAGPNGCQLPTLVHRMEVDEDQLFAEEA